MQLLATGMDRAKLDELAAKVRRGEASAEDLGRALNPALAALIDAARAEEQAMSPEQLEARKRRAERMARAAERRETRRPTIQTYARQLRLRAQLLRVRALHPIRFRSSSCTPGRPRRSRARRFRGRRARAPGRSPDEPLDPLTARVVYAHAAAWRGDRRIGRWLEVLADELLERQA